jgi:hypothetical protein
MAQEGVITFSLKSLKGIPFLSIGYMPSPPGSPISELPQDELCFIHDKEKDLLQTQGYTAP